MFPTPPFSAYPKLTGSSQSHNISANQIRQDANARRAAALASQQAAESGENEDVDDASPSAEPEPAPVRRKKESKAQSEKRKKEEEVSSTAICCTG